MKDDNKSRPGNKKSQEAHVFLVVVRSLGVSLRVYKTNDKWEWTSLLGEEKKILLRKLPDHFEKILLPAKFNMHFVEFCNRRYSTKTQQNATLTGQEEEGDVHLKIS